jgi:hypothetical protein
VDSVVLHDKLWPVTIKRLLLVGVAVWLGLGVFSIVAISAGGVQRSKQQHAKPVLVRKP